MNNDRPTTQVFDVGSKCTTSFLCVFKYIHEHLFHFKKKCFYKISCTLTPIIILHLAVYSFIKHSWAEDGFC